MTLCIAALANGLSEPKIVLCSDMRLGDEYHGTETHFKSDVGFSDTLAALYSGPWEDSINLKRVLMRKAQATKLTLDNYRGVLSDGWKEFDAIFRSEDKKETDAQCVIAGFIEGEPRIIRVQKDGVDTLPFCAAIGIGGYHADTILSWRSITPFTSLEQAMYFAYEAKRFGQLCGDVGEQTLMQILSLSGEGALQVDLVTIEGLDVMEGWFKRFGPQFVLYDLSFPSTAFHRIREED